FLCFRRVRRSLGSLRPLNFGYRNRCDRYNDAPSPHRGPSSALGKLLHESPPVSFVAERMVKFVCNLAVKLATQCDAPNSSLTDISLGSRNQRATNSAPARGA